MSRPARASSGWSLTTCDSPWRGNAAAEAMHVMNPEFPREPFRGGGSQYKRRSLGESFSVSSKSNAVHCFAQEPVKRLVEQSNLPVKLTLERSSVSPGLSDELRSGAGEISDRCRGIASTDAGNYSFIQRPRPFSRHAGGKSIKRPDEARVRADHPLRAIRTIASEALAAPAVEFAALYAPIGRPSIAPRGAWTEISRRSGSGRWGAVIVSEAAATAIRVCRISIGGPLRSAEFVPPAIRSAAADAPRHRQPSSHPCATASTSLRRASQ